VGGKSKKDASVVKKKEKKTEEGERKTNLEAM